jgi:hypothetical protein
MFQWRLSNLSGKHFFINKISLFWRFVSSGAVAEGPVERPKRALRRGCEREANLDGFDLTVEKACDNGQAGNEYEQAFRNQHVRLVVAGQQDPAHGALLLT